MRLVCLLFPEWQQARSGSRIYEAFDSLTYFLRAHHVTGSIRKVRANDAPPRPRMQASFAFDRTYTLSFMDESLFSATMARTSRYDLRVRAAADGTERAPASDELALRR